MCTPRAQPLHGAALRYEQLGTAHFPTAGDLRRLLGQAGASRIETRNGLYLPPRHVPALTARAEKLERMVRPLGPVGAGPRK
jgi:hypothetical protein